MKHLPSFILLFLVPFLVHIFGSLNGQVIRYEDIGFSMEYTNPSGQKTQILPYRRYGADQGNFCTCQSGNYKLIWDNSYSTFFKKVLRYKVDCIPPVVEPAVSSDQVDE